MREIPLSIWERYDAWYAGFDSVIHGSDTTNCFFGLFHSKDSSKWWDAGNLAAKRSCKRHGRKWLQMLLVPLAAEEAEK